MIRQLLLVAALVAIPATAQVPRLPPMSKAVLASHLPAGTTLETRLDADLNGDGLIDTVAIGAGEDKRGMVVLLGYREETDMGHTMAATGELDAYPLGPASLEVRKGVLIVTDLTGGTTAVQSVYCYRYDPASRRMRLIGDDVTQYSRTYQHGSITVSTNRLTGQRIVTPSALAPKGSKAALIPGKPRTSSVPRTPIYMENAPNADDTIAAASGSAR